MGIREIQNPNQFIKKDIKRLHNNKPEDSINNWLGVESEISINHIQKICWFLCFIRRVTELTVREDKQLVWEGKVWVG